VIWRRLEILATRFRGLSIRVCVQRLEQLIAFSVHRWQAHLLDEGAIARVGMDKVESGVRLNQEE